MAGTEGSWRPIRRRAAFAATVVVIGIIVVSLVVASPPPRSNSDASPTPGSSPVASPVASPEASPAEAWRAVELLPLTPVATLEASPIDATGVAPDGRFALTSLTGEPATAMAARVQVSPDAELAIDAGRDERAVTLAPRDGLKPGTQYRFTLQAPDGSLAASWAFRVRSPVHVLGTIPGDRTTAVPVRTGIEVTFDQDGVADMRDHFTIEPAVPGRFERHGRTQVFVPDTLANGTLYTVTVAAGLPRTGTDLALETDVVFRFETAGADDPRPWLQFARDTVETSPTEATVIGVYGLDPEPTDPQQAPAPATTAQIRVYRIPTLDAAASLLADFLVAPRWTAYAVPSMPTDGLPVAATFTATIEPLAGADAGTIRFPEPLPKGWYIAEIQGARPSQAFLQVTPVSAWVSVLTDRTVVWVNDTSTGRPMAGATAGVLDGASIGHSARDGLVIGPTPDALVPPAEAGDREVPETPPLLEVRSASGDVVLVPFEVGWDGGIYRGEWWERTASADSTYWSMLLTERELYRTADVIGVWGYLRGRDDDSVPPTVQLRLVRNDAESMADPPAVARADVAPDAAGTFSAPLRLSRVPIGYYRLQAVVDGRVVASTYVEVGVIRKPAYRLDLEPDRRAVFSGTTVRFTTTATFFDGSPVPDLPITYGSDGTATTDATGSYVVSVKMNAEECTDEYCRWDTGGKNGGLGVSPAVQEEADIGASADVVVFPTSHDIDLEGRLDGRTLRISGSVDEVDLAGVEAAIAAGTWDRWDEATHDPDGAPVPSANVKVTVTELVPVRRQVGSDYDFIEKVVRPRYEYDTRRELVRTLTVRTDSRGRLAANVAVPDAGHQYEIGAETADPQGRAARRQILVGAPYDAWLLQSGMQFRTPEGEGTGEEKYGIGERVAWPITDNGEPVEPAPTDRFLYIVAQRGLRAATVTTSPTFERTFTAADAPRIFVMGIRFTGTTYAPKAAAWANFDETERGLDVTVTADQARYRPGEDATLTITTRDPAGRPVAASVVLQAVDEKLFEMGRASVPDPLARLYAPVDSGIVRLTSTHQVPVDAGSEGEGGNTTANVRSDFRDTVAFRALATDASGRATATIRLSDDLTSWHVSVSAMTADLEAGVDDLLVPVGLPVFVDATVADEYLLSDRPIIRLRAYGEALQADDPVVFTVGSTSLGLPETRLTGTAFREVDVELPDLALGTQSLTITVTAPTRLDAAGKPSADRLVRTFGVVRSRLSAARTEFLEVGRPLPAVVGDEAATYTFTDAGRARYVPYLEAFVYPAGARLDRAIAAWTAHGLLVNAFGRDPATLPPDTFDPTRYPLRVDYEGNSVRDAGVGLLPYGGLDPWLAGRVAILAPEALDAGSLRDVLIAVRDGDATRRDLRIAAVAGLSALGEPVADDLDAAMALDDLTVTEQLHLGLGYAAMGDDASAAAIERDLLSRHGQQLGPWVRLQVGDLDATTEATALLAVLAARVGDPLAPSMMDYVRSQPSGETSLALELVTAAQAALERTPAVAASFAYTVDGERTVVRLEPGESETLVLTAAQRSGLKLEPIAGKTGLAASWREPTDPASLPTDPGLTLTRRIPTDPLPVDHLVTVDLHVTFGPSALEAPCYEVVEEVPSGLAPLASWNVGTGNAVLGPASVVGQRVTFCVPNPVFKDAGVAVREGTLRYLARVVNEGTFTWERAVLQLEGAADVGTTVQAGTVTIGTR
jgi:hypothetical protein